MSIILVDGLPPKISFAQTIKLLARSVMGNFEALQFAPAFAAKKKVFKSCYLRLSEKLDPIRVIQKINTTKHGSKKTPLYAVIPETLPRNLHLSTKRKALPMKLRKHLRIAPDYTRAQVLLLTYDEILKEMQYKYTELYKLSSKTAHKLLESISLTIIERLKRLMRNNAEAASSCFQLSQRYRKAHPHFGDFALTLGTLHELEDAAGAPRTQLAEQDLIRPNKEICVINNVPYTKAHSTCLKYTERIMGKITERINQYNVTPKDSDSPEEEARKKVQTHLKRMMPYLPLIIKQVIINHFTPEQKHGFQRMRIYGEPYQPAREAMQPFLAPFAAVRVTRCDRMANLLLLAVPRDRFPRLMAADGTLLGGTKLVIRSSVTRLYTLPSKIRQKIEAQMDPSVDPSIVYASVDWTKEEL